MLFKKAVVHCLAFSTLMPSPAFAIGSFGASEATPIPSFMRGAQLLDSAELAEIEGEGLGGAVVGAALGAVAGSMSGAVRALIDSASGRHDKAWDTFKAGLVGGATMGASIGFATNPLSTT